MDVQKGARFTYRRCRICKNKFAVNQQALVSDSLYCSECEVIGWFKEMRGQGCHVCPPDKLGKTPYLVKKTIEECPQVEISGVIYRDTTILTMESEKYVKHYPTNEQWKQLNLMHEEKRQQQKLEREMKRRREIERKIKKGQDLANQWHMSKLNDVLDLLECGYTGEQIVAETNITAHELRGLIKELIASGRWVSKRGEAWTEEEIGQAKALREQGKTISSIAKYLNRSCGAVQAKLTADLTGDGTRKKYTKEDEKIIREMYHKGKTSTQIAKVLNRSSSSVGSKIQHMKKKGLIHVEK